MTAAKSGLKTAVISWPGAEIDFNGIFIIISVECTMFAVGVVLFIRVNLHFP